MIKKYNGKNINVKDVFETETNYNAIYKMYNDEKGVFYCDETDDTNNIRLLGVFESVEAAKNDFIDFINECINE